jgi:predicted small lipoprotein YifL
MSFRSLALTLVLATLASGCGLKGPLYLPEKAGPVTTRPGPAAPAATPATSPAAEQPAARPSGEPPPPPDGTSDKTGG